MTKRTDSSHRNATGLDAHLGTKLRNVRLAAGVSQAALGKALGVSFQQIQKYEAGTNRMSASTLYEACHALDVAVESMFDGFKLTKPRRP